eukprot:scaffold280925_cov35-Tisochrysis_lutea.AAC.2
MQPVIRADHMKGGLQGQCARTSVGLPPNLRSLPYPCLLDPPRSLNRCEQPPWRLPGLISSARMCLTRGRRGGIQHPPLDGREGASGRGTDRCVLFAFTLRTLTS